MYCQCLIICVTDQGGSMWCVYEGPARSWLRLIEPAVNGSVLDGELLDPFKVSFVQVNDWRQCMCAVQGTRG